MSDELIAKIDKAHKVVCDLCSGKREWIMSIPAQPDDDPDLIIGESLRKARAEIISLRSRVEELEKENAKLRWQLEELRTMLTACGFEVIEDYNKRKAIKGHGIIYMQDRAE